MTAYPPVRPAETQIWLYELSACAAEISRLHTLLDQQEQMRSNRYRVEADRDRFIIAHGRLRELLGAILNLPAATVRIIHNKGEKPVLADAASGIHFNLSHSDGVAVAALATQPVGVDVEVVRPLAERDHIAAGYFAPGESDALRALPEAVRHQAFFSAWTRKEAFAKAIGLGLSMPFNEFEVSIGQPTRICTVKGSCDEAAAWSLWSASLDDRAWVAAAVRDPRASFVMRNWHDHAF